MMMIMIMMIMNDDSDSDDDDDDTSIGFGGSTTTTLTGDGSGSGFPFVGDTVFALLLGSLNGLRGGQCDGNGGGAGTSSPLGTANSPMTSLTLVGAVVVVVASVVISATGTCPNSDTNDECLASLLLTGLTGLTAVGLSPSSS